MIRDDYDLDGDKIHCGICGCVVTPANFAAWDPWDVFCASCQTAAEREYGVDESVGVPTEAEYRRAMTTTEALAMAVEAAMGGRNLLNGADEESDECEPETKEVTVPSMVDLMADGTFGRKAAA